MHLFRFLCYFFIYLNPKHGVVPRLSPRIFFFISVCTHFLTDLHSLGIKCYIQTHKFQLQAQPRPWTSYSTTQLPTGLTGISRLRCQKSNFWFPAKTGSSYMLLHPSSCLMLKPLKWALTCLLLCLISKQSGNPVSYIFKNESIIPPILTASQLSTSTTWSHFFYHLDICNHLLTPC